VPLGGGYAGVAVDVEIFEGVFTVVIDLGVFGEELGP
jgi:hypothetical protein